MSKCINRCTTTPAFPWYNPVYNCDAIFVISVEAVTRVYIHNEAIDLNNHNSIGRTSLCAYVTSDDVINKGHLNPIKCEYGPVWGRYVYVYVWKGSLPLCEIEIYKESGMWII